MTTFQQLPLELQEKIFLLSDPDYEAVSRVSKKWRRFIKTSKSVMQRELDKYFFFFIVWYEWPWPSFNPPPRFVFPITNEEWFTFLWEHAQTGNSQVIAFERTKNYKDLFWDDFLTEKSEDNGPSWYPANLTEEQKELEKKKGISLGATETLVERLKECRREEIRATLHNFICSIPRSERRWFHKEPDFKDRGLTRGPKFSNKDLMLKLLRNEHKVFRDFQALSLVFLKQENYELADSFFRKMLVELTNIHQNDVIARVNESYGTLTKSLVQPCWRNRGELEFNLASLIRDLHECRNYDPTRQELEDIQVLRKNLVLFLRPFLVQDDRGVNSL